jgi:hypothetical protein
MFQRTFCLLLHSQKDQRLKREPDVSRFILIYTKDTLLYASHISDYFCKFLGPSTLPKNVQFYNHLTNSLNPKLI